MISVTLITKPSKQATGLSRYEDSLVQGLGETQQVKVNVAKPVSFSQRVAKLVSWTGVDLVSFFNSYPVRADLDPADIYHLTSQGLATLAVFQKIRPAIVTVHDIIPYIVKSDPRLNTFRHPFDAWFYRLSIAGIRRADAIIAISEYTKKTLIDHLGLSADRITVVPRAVELDRFFPVPVGDDFRANYDLPANQQYVLYVGSEDPRKNLPALMRAFARLCNEVEHVKLIKVGAPHFSGEREKLKALIDELGIADHVLFMNHVPDGDLPLFYNVADVTVMPSLYEGFGLPALESIACGTPVVVANAASLPEVVGDAGCVVDPSNVSAFAQALQRILNDRDFRDDLSQKGLERAQRFSITTQAMQTRAAYQKLRETV
jgi:glycosyltransferase involved in cell wall biosynthesis